MVPLRRHLFLLFATALFLVAIGAMAQTPKPSPTVSSNSSNCAATIAAIVESKDLLISELKLGKHVTDIQNAALQRTASETSQKLTKEQATSAKLATDNRSAQRSLADQEALIIALRAQLADAQLKIKGANGSNWCKVFSIGCIRDKKKKTKNR